MPDTRLAAKADPISPSPEGGRGPARRRPRTATHAVLERKQAQASGLSLVLWSVAAVILTVAIWQAAVVISQQPAYLLPGPAEVLNSVADNWATLVTESRVTLVESVLGLIIGAVAAILLASAFIWFPLVRRALYPFTAAIQAMPKVALAPLFVAWFGVAGITGKVVLAILVCFFPMVVNTVAGLDSIDAKQKDVLRSMGATRWQMFLKLQLPWALPLTFAGLKIAALFAVVGAVIGELVGGSHGLGYVMAAAMGSIDVPLMFASLIFQTAVGALLYAAVVVANSMLKRFMVDRI